MREEVRARPTADCGRLRSFKIVIFSRLNVRFTLEPDIELLLT